MFFGVTKSLISNPFKSSPLPTKYFSEEVVPLKKEKNAVFDFLITKGLKKFFEMLTETALFGFVAFELLLLETSLTLELTAEALPKYLSSIFWNSGESTKT